MDLYGIIGNPAHHSMSPPLYQAAYEEYGMDAEFVTFEVPPAEFEQAIRGAKALGIEGLSVTMPFKQEIIQFVELDDVTQQIGAVNTVDFTEGDFATGYNTDGIGARRALKENGASIDGNAVIVGAGGTGRAISSALADSGMSVDVHNRTVEKAKQIEDFIPSATGFPLDELEDNLSEASILVDATSVGLHELASVVPADVIHSDLTVLDVVYTPLETKLLRDAKDRGATVVDGASMLVYQGVEAFEIWTRKEAPVDAMSKAVRNALPD